MKSVHHRVPNMSAYIPDVKSLFGSKASQPAKVPSVGEKAPSVEGVNYTQSGHLIAFVRHCGCPFAEKEVRQLARVAKENQKIRIVIVAHSADDVVQDWFKRIGAPHFESLDRVVVRADPDYRLYNAFGIGQLGWDKLFTRETLSNVKALAAAGIKNTPTGQGSNRWLNSGGFAVDHGGILRWVKVAEQASDMCDYEEAVRTLSSPISVL